MAGRTIQDDASRGRGSRLFGRQFISRMAALGAASLLILFALQACGGEDEDPTPTTGTTVQTPEADGATATRAGAASPAASPRTGAAASPAASPRTGAAASPAASPRTGAAASPAVDEDEDVEDATPEP